MTEGDWDPCEAVTTSWPPTLVYWVEYTLEPVVPNPLLTLAGVVGHSAVGAEERNRAIPGQNRDWGRGPRTQYYFGSLSASPISRLIPSSGVLRAIDCNADRIDERVPSSDAPRREINTFVAP